MRFVEENTLIANEGIKMRASDDSEWVLTSIKGRSRKYFGEVAIAILIMALSSCATATVYIDPLANNYVNIPIVSQTAIFMGKKDITLSNYTLKWNKTI